MALPFTIEEFLAVFARYNEGIWPLPVLAQLLGVPEDYGLIAAGVALLGGLVGPGRRLRGAGP